MNIDSPFAELYNDLLIRLESIDALKFIDEDFGQLEHYDLKPAVVFPCALIDISDFNFTEVGGKNEQMGNGIIQIRIGFEIYTPTNSLVPSSLREKGLAMYNIEQKVHKQLQGWNSAPFSRLLRRSLKTERRRDNIKVRVLTYATSFKDNSTAPVMTKVAVPNPQILV
jgi:hypothetical protein